MDRLHHIARVQPDYRIDTMRELGLAIQASRNSGDLADIQIDETQAMVENFALDDSDGSSSPVPMDTSGLPLRTSLPIAEPTVLASMQAIVKDAHDPGNEPVDGMVAVRRLIVSPTRIVPGSA